MLFRSFYSNGRGKFYIKGDTTSIRIENPRCQQPVNGYLENVQAYIEKSIEVACDELGLSVGDEKPEEWIFGERIDPISSAAIEEEV